MRVENHIYIYKGPYSKMSLENYVNYFSNVDENKEEIINTFEKKFKYDFLESSQLLIDNNYLYPVSMILVNSIDTLAKHYTGNCSDDEIGPIFRKFFRERLVKKLREENSKISSKSLVKQFYKEFRCSITHSNSTSLHFTIDKEISNICLQDNILVINLEHLRESIGRALEEYISLLRTNSTYFEKFIEVQKKIYNIEKELEKKRISAK